MASRRKAIKPHPDANDDAAPPVSDTRVLARVLALRFTRRDEYKDRMAFLIGAGFSRAEIASMLNITSTSVRTALHRMRKRAGK